MKLFYPPGIRNWPFDRNISTPIGMGESGNINSSGSGSLYSYIVPAGRKAFVSLIETNILTLIAATTITYLGAEIKIVSGAQYVYDWYDRTLNNVVNEYTHFYHPMGLYLLEGQSISANWQALFSGTGTYQVYGVALINEFDA